MTEPRIYSMPFAKIYPLYQQKLAKKGRSTAELNQAITWLTGYDHTMLEQQLATTISVQDFFTQMPRLNPRASEITGTICGVRVETIAAPTMQRIRYLDKLVDELAKGKPLRQVLREE
ncbi:DUF2200 domain-containing protein [Levilactobacillus tongjiangensis]|uniref:DUF2200 domain-containing protein n=1 Tax=Levilactobacillus tongjiangensis TaxID=2486023 RepID=A0ABW1SRU8_9LACO|nr:DUF2200 domain-containing protein [Levilactobacillus tongjiangensis]